MKLLPSEIRKILRDREYCRFVAGEISFSQAQKNYRKNLRATGALIPGSYVCIPGYCIIVESDTETREYLPVG